MSWAWRPFLCRLHPLLLSGFRPVRRHGSQLATVFGRNNLIGSREYASDCSGDATAKGHLYVVLDDHKDGFGVHKLDLGDIDDDDGLDRGTTRRLTQPPVLRVALATLGKRVQFAAVGSSIVAMGNTIISPALAERWIPPIGGVLIYDTETMVLTVTPHLPAGLVGGYKAAMAVGNCLYMVGSEPPEAPLNYDWVDDWDYGGGSLHCLTIDPPYPDDNEGDKFWGWQVLSHSSPWLWSNFRSPPMVPFMVDDIRVYGAQASPPGVAAPHELLVSLRPMEMRMLGATCSFSTTSREWTRRFEWHLPVFGHAHYDSHLDVWVGLNAVNDGDMYGPRVTDGHLCVGNVTSSPSEWKVGNDKIFRFDEDDAAGWRHVDAKLVPIELGEGGSEYCASWSACVVRERWRRIRGERGRQRSEGVLGFSSFSVERGQDSEPVVMVRGLARSYEVSWHSRHFDAQAFWI